MTEHPIQGVSPRRPLPHEMETLPQPPLPPRNLPLSQRSVVSVATSENESTSRHNRNNLNNIVTVSGVDHKHHHHHHRHSFFRQAIIPPKDQPPNQFYRVHIERVIEILSQRNSQASKRTLTEAEEQKMLIAALKTPMTMTPYQENLTVEHVQKSPLKLSSDSSGAKLIPSPPRAQQSAASQSQTFLQLPAMPQSKLPVNHVHTYHADAQDSDINESQFSTLPDILKRHHQHRFSEISLKEAQSDDDDDDSDRVAPIPLDRRASRMSVGQIEQSKKATARITRVMFCINITQSSPLIQFFQSVNAEVLSRMIAQNCRLAKRMLDREDFRELIKRIVADCCSGSDRAADAAAAASSSQLVSPLRKPSMNVSAFASPRRMQSMMMMMTDASPPLSLSEGLKQQQQPQQVGNHISVRREDTDPIFALFDEDETGVVYSKQFRDRFFTIALASKSDILYRLVQMLFAKSTYHTLEATISRFELQIIAELFQEVFMMGGATLKQTLKRMRDKDREAVICYEAVHPTAGLRKDEADASAEAKAERDELRRLRGLVDQSEADREARLRMMLHAVETFPDQINNVPKGCLTIRELRELCHSTLRYNILGDESITDGTGWKKHKRSFVKQSFRFDEIFLDMSKYLELTPSPSTISNLPARAGLVVSAANFLSRGGDRSSSASSMAETVRADDDIFSSSGKDRNSSLAENDLPEDPILAEAVEDGERRAKRQMTVAKKALIASFGDSVKKRSASSAQDAFSDLSPSNGRAGRLSVYDASQSQADLFRRTTADGMHSERFAKLMQQQAVGNPLGNSAEGATTTNEQQQQQLNLGTKVDSAQSSPSLGPSSSLSSPTVLPTTSTARSAVAAVLAPFQRKKSVTYIAPTGASNDEPQAQESLVISTDADVVQHHHQRLAAVEREHQRVNEELLRNPPEHEQPTFVTRNGVVYRCTPSCPEGKPALQSW